ncbi:hypothetical protein B0H10DRAFT_1955920 [Mycena sp. CBHHK59/15]|nr:hypothetical protein B0H10DRAFT_1955920 [Mycena sp. CBHHK59/15]
MPHRLLLVCGESALAAWLTGAFAAMQKHTGETQWQCAQCHAGEEQQEVHMSVLRHITWCMDAACYLAARCKGLHELCEIKISKIVSSENVRASLSKPKKLN